MRQMKQLLCSLYFLFICTTVTAQQEPKDSLYPLVLFYEGSNCKIDSNYRYVLQDMIRYLKENKEVHVLIRGHVCCGPDKKLSTKRAKKAYRYLKKNGISTDRLSYKGVSNDFPLRFPEKTEEDEAMNRRVDFVLTFPKE